MQEHGDEDDLSDLDGTGNDEEEDEVVRIGEYDSEGNATGACPRCGVSPVYEYGMGGGTCGHYLALYDSWGGRDDFTELPALPCLGAEWEAACAALFPVETNSDRNNVFAPSPTLTQSFLADLPLLNAWTGQGLYAPPSWNDEVVRDILLSEANGVEAVGYNTGTVYYAPDGGDQLRRVVARLAEGFELLAARLKPFREMRWTALHYACLEEDASELVRDALGRGSDPNTRDTDGHTPLMMSAGIGDLGAVRLLLAAGADPNVANNEGRSAWDFAREEEYTEILKALAEAGAEQRW